MIDPDGFRKNVGIILVNSSNKVFFARRISHNGWQFPQGGLKSGETPEQGMYRELYEEVGLKPEHVKVVAETEGWLQYRLPEALIRHQRKPVVIGQRQKWFLLKFLGEDEHICLETSEKPEFDGWQWVDYWYPLHEVVSFKREVYQQALEAFHSFLEA